METISYEELPNSVEELAIQIFHERDIREGLGDRKLFRETMKILYQREPSLATKRTASTS
jgi:hypothetical protein